MKDYFSGHSEIYAAYRPVYPDTLYQYIYSHLNGNEAAWDCATGNGQVASELAKHFQKVYATDISEKQLAQATQSDNIIYSVSKAERTFFPDNQFDLITVGQALHWFDLEKFYNEVNRVAKEKALLAVWGYELCRVDHDVDKLFLDYYHNIVGPYWDEARKLVEDHYRSLPFPFEKIDTPDFFIEVHWPLETFLGYLTSWSATQTYIKEKGNNPLEALSVRLQKFWPLGEVRHVTFPMFVKLGKV
jgi:hypothetical protein